MRTRRSWRKSYPWPPLPCCSSSAGTSPPLGGHVSHTCDTCHTCETREGCCAMWWCRVVETLSGRLFRPPSPLPHSPTPHPHPHPHPHPLPLPVFPILWTPLRSFLIAPATPTEWQNYSRPWDCFPSPAPSPQPPYPRPPRSIAPTRPRRSHRGRGRPEGNRNQYFANMRAGSSIDSSEDGSPPAALGADSQSTEP